MIDWNESRDLLWLAVILYGVGLVLGLRLASKTNKLVSSFLPLAIIITGFVAQTQGLALRGQLVKGCPLGNGMERIQFILWSLVLGYLIIRVLFRLNLLGSFAAGVASLGGALSLLIPSLGVPYWEKKRLRGPFPQPLGRITRFGGHFQLWNLWALGNGQHDVLDSAKGLANQTPRITGSLPAIHSTDGNCGSPPFAHWIGLPHLLHRRGLPRLDPSLWLGKLCQSDRHHCVVVSLLLALVSALSRKAFWPKVRQDLHHPLRGGHFVSRGRAFRGYGSFAPILSTSRPKCQLTSQSCSYWVVRTGWPPWKSVN